MRKPGTRREPEIGMRSRRIRLVPSVQVQETSGTRSKLARAQNGLTARRDGSDENKLAKVFANILILTRRTGETVMIGHETTVTVLGVKGNQVRLGINAPKDVPVHREEIYERIKKEMAGEEPDGNG